jgi:putative hydrolase of the HAD superfamily
MMKMIDTIFFDNWNTLVQAPNLMKRGSSTKIFHEYLLDNGIDIPYDSFINAYVPISRKQVEEADRAGYKELDYKNRLERVFKFLDVEDYQLLAERAWKIYLNEWPKQTEFFPATRKILDGLKGNYKLGLITNYMDGPTCREVFNKLGYYEIFDSLVVSAELGYRKPAEVIFEQALKEIGSESGSSLMVGDTFEADIVGANSMGMKNILVDVYDNQHENYHECTAVIKDISQFPEGLKKILNT